MLAQKLSRFILSLGILVAAGFLIASNFIKVNAEEIKPLFYQIVKEEEEKKDFNDDIINILEKEEYQIYICVDKSYVLKNDEVILELSGNIIDFLIDEKLYFLFKDKIISYDFKNTFEKKIPECSLSSFTICNSMIAASGCKENDGYLVYLSKDLNITKEILLGGSGYEEFLNVYFYNDLLYIVGRKDSVSNNSIFKNCGINDTKKIFMFSYQNQIIDEVYFDNVDWDENLVTVLYLDKIYVQLDCNKIYVLDYKLKVLPIKKYDLAFDSFFIDIKNEINYFKSQDNALYLNDHLIIKDLAKVFKIEVKEGLIKLYRTTDTGFIIENYFEYQIFKNDDLILSKYNFDFQSLNNLEVESLLEPIEKEIDHTFPSLQKQVDGIYQVSYKLTRTFSKKCFYLDGKLIIKPFVNIIDKGIYKINKELNFLGTAKLNDLEIYNGYKITKSGDYTLKLTDINKNEKIYHFSVLDNFYKDDPCVTFTADFNVLPNEDVSIYIYLENPSDVKEVVINHKISTDFSVTKNAIKINIKGKEFYSIDYYNIDKLILENNQEIIINEGFTVKTLRKSPEVVLNLKTQDDLIYLDYEIIDGMQSIMYLKEEILEKNQVKENFFYYFDDNFNLFNFKNNNYLIKYYLSYYDGNTFRDLKLLEFNSGVEDLNKVLDVDKQLDLSIGELDFKFNGVKSELKELKVNNIDILKDIKIDKPNINLKIILLISIPIILIVGLVIFLKIKILHKKYKSIE